MSGLIGWIGKSGSAAPRLGHFSPFDPAQERVTDPDHAALSVSVHGFEAAVRGNRIECHVHSEGPVHVVACGRPRLRTVANNEDLGVVLSAVARRFATFGDAALPDITGPFAVAIYDERRRQGVVAIDRMGIGVVFFHALPDGILFGTNPAAMAAAAGIRPALSRQAIFDYVYFHVVPAPHAVFDGFRRLLPGEYLTIGDGPVEPRRYWQMRFDEHRDEPFEQLKRRFREVLEASVRDVATLGRCGAFLSGGTDSSTICGLIGAVTGTPAECFSIGFEAEGYDEMAYARVAARHFGLRHHEYYTTPQDIVAAVPRLAASNGQPFGNSSALPAYYCAKIARDHGVEVMIGGDGGDELFGGNERYARNQVFALYERLPRMARRHLLEPMSAALANGPRLPGVGKVVSYVQQAATPMPERLHHAARLSVLGPEHVFDDAILDGIDPDEPLRLLEQEFFNPTAASLINRHLALDLKITLSDNDLPKVVGSCDAAGVVAAFPLLDERVVDFSAALPPQLKLKGTRLRYFFKEALRDFLPAEILSKKKQGFGLPFGEWAVRDAALRQLTFDSLNALKRRQLVRPSFLDRLKDELLPSHPAYFGTTAWVLMMLEQWLEQHIDATANESQAG